MGDFGKAGSETTHYRQHIDSLRCDMIYGSRHLIAVNGR
jgi:hypothetical protein